jgi:hypothetical protein
MFANDTLMFMEVLEDQDNVVNKALRRYEKCMGQLINPNKCSMMMGADCVQVTKDRVMQILQVSNVMVEEKYLELPAPQRQMCKNKFKTMKERLAK